MYIDQFKRNRFYIDSDGNIYESAEDYIKLYIFKFCGCGFPDEALKYIEKALQLVKYLSYAHENKISYNSWKIRKNMLFKNEGDEYFMWYFLSEKGLIQHGSSLPGWLTEKGSGILSDINEILSKIK